MSPAIILVPGMSSIDSVVYAPLIEELKKANVIHVEAVDLPSIDCVATKAALKPNALEADIAKIKSAIISALTTFKTDVIVAAHSYRGTPSLYACEGLWKAARLAGAPGVFRVTLLISSLSLPGGSVAGDREEYAKANGGIDDSGAGVQMISDELILLPGPGSASVWFSNLAGVDRKKWTATLRPTAPGNVLSTTNRANVKPWKMSYLVTTDLDAAMPEVFQEHLAARARDAGAEVEIEKISSGRFVQIAHATEVAEWVEGIC